MSYKEKIDSAQKELLDMFIKDLYDIKGLALQSKNKEELINKLRETYLFTSTAYYYIKDDNIEDIVEKVNKLQRGDKA